MKKIIVLTISIIPIGLGFITGATIWLILLVWASLVEGYRKGRGL